MFKDCDGNELRTDDPVTVIYAKRHKFAGGSHGTVVKFGRTLVHVRLTYARMEIDDGQVHGFDPGELRKGHHGRPRHPEGRGAEMRELFTNYRNDAFDSLIGIAVERKVITPAQADAMKTLYGELD